MRIIDGVNFIRANGLLEDWTNEQIALGIKAAIVNCSLTFAEDGNGNLTALAFGRWTSSTSIRIITFAGKGYVKTFIKYLREVHPNVTSLSMFRRGKLKTLNFK